MSHQIGPFSQRGNYRFNSRFSTQFLSNLLANKFYFSVGPICSAYRILGSIVVSIRACHVRDPGSIPGRGVTFCPFSFLLIKLKRRNCY